MKDVSDLTSIHGKVLLTVFSVVIKVFDQVMIIWVLGNRSDGIGVGILKKVSINKKVTQFTV